MWLIQALYVWYWLYHGGAGSTGYDISKGHLGEKEVWKLIRKATTKQTFSDSN